MVKLRVRYLVAKPRKDGVAYYWQPWKPLRDAGFLVRRLSDNRAEAIRQAEELNAEVDAYYSGTAPVAIKPGSVKALVKLYRADERFKKLRPRTQDDYDYSIAIIEHWAGDFPARALTRKAIREWYRALRDKRGNAVSGRAAAMLRVLLNFALDEGWIEGGNPADRMRLSTVGGNTRVWTMDEVTTLAAKARELGHHSIAAAVLLAAYTAQRPADILAVAWSAYDGRTLAFVQAKTGRAVPVPVIAPLRQALAETKRADALQIVVDEATGRPYAMDRFQKRFAEVRQAAGLPAELKFYGLRHTAATALGAAGATDDEIRAITGHATRAVVARYVQPDRRFADSAMRKLARHHRNEQG